MELKVLTLNCWGIPVISKDRKPRMEAIAMILANEQYDIVCLQEVWTDSDYNLITSKVKAVLPFSHYFYSGVIGSGICILSKYQFQEVFFHQWPVNGYVHKLQHGDWFGGKGVGLCRLRINNFNINVYSAHLHAEYDRTCDEYMAHRVLQAFDTAQFIRLTGNNSDLIILAGDLNTEPGDLAYRILMSATGLVDSYIEAAEKAGTFFSTNESCTNSYTDSKLISAKFEGKRIDYIMYRNSANVQVALKSYNHPLPDRIPGCKYSYSDHEAVTACIELKKRNENSFLTCANNFDSISLFKNVLIDSMAVCDQAMNRLNYHRRLYWFFTCFLFFMLFVTIGIDAPFSFTKVYDLVRFFVTAVLCFTLIMATLWNNIEYNAVLGGKLNMNVNLKQILDNEKPKKM